MIFFNVFSWCPKKLLTAEARVRPVPPHLKPVHFLKNHTRSARPSPHGPARPEGESSWTAHLCCGNSSILIKELWRHLSFHQRTAETLLKIETVLGLTVTLIFLEIGEIAAIFTAWSLEVVH